MNIAITRLSGLGFRGRDFDHNLQPVCVFTGANGAGKSSRLIALDLALRGPQRGDERYGEPTHCSIQAVIEQDEQETVINRGLCPKHTLSIAGKTQSLGDGQSELDRLLGGVSEVFDLGKFLTLSPKDQVKRLLELSAYVSATEVSALWPEVVPAKGESAQAWLARAREALRTERLTLEQMVKDEQKTAVTLVGDTRGQLVDLVPLRQELDDVEREQRQLGLRDVERAQLIGTQKELDAWREQAKSLAERIEREQTAIQPELAATAAQAVVTRYQELAAQRTASQAKVALEESLHHQYNQACADLRNLEDAQRPARAALAALLAAVECDGNPDVVLIAYEYLKQALDTHGWPAKGPTERQRIKVSAELDKLGPVTRVSDQELGAAHRAAMDAGHQVKNAEQIRLANTQRRELIAKLSAELESRQLSITQHEILAAQLQARMDAMPVPDPEHLADLSARQTSLRQRIEQVVAQQAVRAREVELQKQVAQRQERLQKIKAQEAVLATRSGEILRQSLAPLAEALQPFLDIIGAGPFELGPDTSPLGIRRHGQWLPFAALSDSEQGVLTTGLALVLQTAKRKGLRLLMLDRLDVCDVARQEALLGLAHQLVTDGKLDQFLATTHMAVNVPNVQVIQVQS